MGSDSVLLSEPFAYSFIRGRTRQSSGGQRYGVPTAQAYGSPRVYVPDGTDARDDGEKCAQVCGSVGAPHRHKGKSPVGASAGKPHLLAKCFDRLIYTDKFRIGGRGGGCEWGGQGCGVGAEMVGKCRFKGGFFLFLKIDISPKKSA